MTQNFTELKQEFYYVIYANFSEQELETIDVLNFMDFEETPEWLDIQVLTDLKKIQATKTYFIDSPIKDDIISESDPEVVNKTITAKNAITISGGMINPANGLDNYIEVIIMLEIILASYVECVSVFDLKTKTLLDRNEWLTQVVTNLSNDVFEISDHVLTLKCEQDDQSIWARTNGMIKFGKPDLSIHNIENAEAEETIEFINNLAAELIYNNSMPVNNSEIILDDVPQSMIALHKGDYQDENFADNVHIEIVAAEVTADLS